MPQGNFVAYQALKPAELKTGDLITSWVDDYIKRDDAAKAAQAKALADQKKSMGELVAKINPQIFTTLQSFQPQTNAIYQKIIDNKNILGQMSDSGVANQDYYNLKQQTENLASQYLQLGTMLTNPQFLDADKKITEQIASGDYFHGDDNIGKYMSFKSGIARLNTDNSGNITVSYVPSKDSENHDLPATTVPITQFLSEYTGGVQKDLKDDIEKQLQQVGAQAASKVNKDGNITYSSKDFDANRARNTITQLMGLDPNKPVADQFTSANNLTDFAKQYFYGNGRYHLPQNGDDLKAMVDDAVNFAKGYVDKSYGLDTQYTGAQLQHQNNQLVSDGQEKVIRGQQITKNTKELAGGGSDDSNPLGNGTISAGNVILNIKNPTTGTVNNLNTQGVSYYVKGATDNGKATNVGVTTYWNPNAKGAGQGGFSFAMNLPSNDGKQVVIQGVDVQRASQILASNKVKNPEGILKTMVNTAIQNGYANKNPQVFGKNYQNYNVDFTPYYKPDGGSS